MEVRRAIAFVMILSGLVLAPLAALDAVNFGPDLIYHDSDDWEDRWDHEWNDHDDDGWHVRWDHDRSTDYSGPLDGPGGGYSGPLDEHGGGYSGPLDGPGN